MVGDSMTAEVECDYISCLLFYSRRHNTEHNGHCSPQKHVVSFTTPGFLSSLFCRSLPVRLAIFPLGFLSFTLYRRWATTTTHSMPVSPLPARWMSPPPVYDSRLTVSNSGLTPYLQLSHILSLTWLASPILSLLFVAFRLLLSSDSAQVAVNNAKGDLLTGCQAAQQAASAAASMPRFMAIATNEQITDAVNASMNGARDALILSLTVMEAVINFLVDIYRSTFLCFLELVIGGGLSLILGATQEVRLAQFFLKGHLTSLSDQHFPHQHV
jgi:hypothetical protein